MMEYRMEWYNGVPQWYGIFKTLKS
jgi:hypothetical protein